MDLCVCMYLCVLTATGWHEHTDGSNSFFERVLEQLSYQQIIVFHPNRKLFHVYETTRSRKSRAGIGRDMHLLHVTLTYVVYTAIITSNKQVESSHCVATNGRQLLNLHIIISIYTQNMIMALLHTGLCVMVDTAPASVSVQLATLPPCLCC